MYAVLKEKTTLDVELPDRTLNDCEIVSRWEGMVKMLHPASGLYLIIMLEEGLVVDGSKSLIDDLLAPIAPTVEPGYIYVPGRVIECGDYRIDVKPFIVSQLLNCIVDGKAAVFETVVPRVNINYYDAEKACKLVNGGQIRGSQHLALAMDIMSVDANWSGGKVGQGILKRGLHRGTVSCAQPGTHVSPHADEDRWFLLPDGQRICDFCGHLFQRMFDDIHGNADGLTGKIPADSPYLVIGNLFTQAQGMGYRPTGPVDWSSGALVRGGCWGSGGVAGVFYLNYGDPDCGYGDVGFRCTKPMDSDPRSRVAA